MTEVSGNKSKVTIISRVGGGGRSCIRKGVFKLLLNGPELHIDVLKKARSDAMPRSCQAHFAPTVVLGMEYQRGLGLV